MSKLSAPDKLQVSRTTGVNTFMKLPLIEDLSEIEGEDVDYAVVGIPIDSGAGYRVGQRFAPNSIRELSAMLRAINMEIGVNVNAELKGFDFGDVNVHPFSCEESLKEAGVHIAKLTERGIIPITMGGDHSITLGPLRAVAKKHGPLGVVHFDSHVDVYEEGWGYRYNNGTTLTRAMEEGLVDPNRIITIGIKGTLFSEEYGGQKSRDLGIDVITMGEFEKIGIDETVKRIREKVGDQPTYLTFDIDCMDPAFIPGGAVYEMGGFTSREVIQMLQGIKDLNFVGYDVAEICPPYDVGGISSYTAAAIMHMFIAMVGIRKRKLAEKK